MKGFISWRSTGCTFDEIELYERDGEYRASREARRLGEEEYKNDWGKRLKDTDTYYSS